MPEAPSAVVFDFDGVILESVDVKTDAFRRLFEREGPEAVERILAFHRANGGISRYEKFRWAYREILKRGLSAGDEKALGERFNSLVEDAVAECDWVPGARECLSSLRGTLPLYIASGTPTEELRRIVARRGLETFFRGVFGSPTTKTEILRQVAELERRPPHTLVMVGDAVTDFKAAVSCGARFIGRTPVGAACQFPAGTEVLSDLRRLPEALGLKPI